VFAQIPELDVGIRSVAVSPNGKIVAALNDEVIHPRASTRPCCSASAQSNLLRPHLNNETHVARRSKFCD
jgi:hypothetical protein